VCGDEAARVEIVADMTQIDLASRAGVSRPTLMRIESGHPRPEMDVVLRIVSALGLAIDAIPEPPAPIDLDALIDSTSSFDARSSSVASVEGGSRRCGARRPPRRHDHRLRRPPASW